MALFEAHPATQMQQRGQRKLLAREAHDPDQLRLTGREARAFEATCEPPSRVRLPRIGIGEHHAGPGWWQACRSDAYQPFRVLALDLRKTTLAEPHLASIRTAPGQAVGGNRQQRCYVERG